MEHPRADSERKRIEEIGENDMNTWVAFAMGEANREKELMVFDWDKAARLIRERKPECAERHEACWGMCEKYKAWKARLDEVNKRRKEYSQKPFVKYNPYDY